MGAYYFLACLLPPLPSLLGEKLPIPFFELTQLLRRQIYPSDGSLLIMHLSVIDAANWERFELGLDLFVQGGILSRQDMVSKRNLPEFIQTFLTEKEKGIRRPYIYDRLWELYYDALLTEAKEKKCRFVIDYIGWEIELRNRLSSLRLRNSSWNVEEHVILSAFQNYDFSTLLSKLEGQKNPLSAERTLDGERLNRILHCMNNDPFSMDSLMAYLSRAMIYKRWEALQTPYDLSIFNTVEVHSG
jgi:hypothetical protein